MCHIVCKGIFLALDSKFDKQLLTKYIFFSLTKWCYWVRFVDLRGLAYTMAKLQTNTLMYMQKQDVGTIPYVSNYI